MNRTTPALFAASLAALLSTTVSLPAQTRSPDGDPKNGEVPLPAAEGWSAFLVFDAGVGVWNVQALQVRPELACPELVALDDDGRATILVSYSGKWTPNATVEDGNWFGPIAQVDLDPDVPGNELYAGGKSGTIYEIHERNAFDFDGHEIAHFPDREIHTLVGGDLWPESPGGGDELLAFTRGGDVQRIARSEDGELRSGSVGRTLGRVRDAILVESGDHDRPTMLTVSRAGRLCRRHLDADGQLQTEVLLTVPMGLGRVTRGRGAFSDVYYLTRDDGIVLRVTLDGETATAEPIYAGPQGPRGIAAGRFAADPAVECVAVFGYSARVQLLSREGDGPWRVETIFTDTDRGHWLTVAEVDGRNATDELVCSGYGGRVVLLSRRPGTGLEIATDPEAETADRRADRDVVLPPRPHPDRPVEPNRPPRRNR